MKEQIVIGLFTLGGAIVGGLFTYLAAKIGFKKEEMKKLIIYLAKQAKSFYILEQEYLSEINTLNHNITPKDTIKKNARKAVKNKGYELITLTENDADKILQKYK